MTDPSLDNPAVERGLAGAVRPALSPTRLALRRFRRNRLALAGLVVLVAIVATAIGGLVQDRLAAWRGEPQPYRTPLPGIHPQPPSLGHPFGTDTLGRDMLARTLVGGCVSLGVGLAAAIVSVLVGTVWGLVAGYVGRGVDTVMMRVVDVLYGLPYILLVILLLVLFTQQYAWVRVTALFLAIGGVSWLTMARVVRGQVLVLREAEFVQAARAMGTRTGRIIFREMMPN
ncbi:MAG: ABC transporter permease, partial [Phycisphaerae bacterium]